MNAARVDPPHSRVRFALSTLAVRVRTYFALTRIDINIDYIAICPLTDSLRKSHGRGLRSKSNSNLDVILSQRAQPHTEASTVQCTESTMTVNPPHPRLRVGPPSHSPDSNSLMAFLRLHGAPHNYCSSTGTGPRRAYMYTPKLCEASFASEFLNITPSNSVK